MVDAPAGAADWRMSAPEAQASAAGICMMPPSAVAATAIAMRFIGVYLLTAFSGRPRIDRPGAKTRSAANLFPGDGIRVRRNKSEAGAIPQGTQRKAEEVGDVLLPRRVPSRVLRRHRGVP